MVKLSRIAALAAVAALAACAPVKLNVLPSVSYEPAAPVEPNADQQKIVRHIQNALKDRAIVTQVVADGSAMAAASMLVNRQAEATGVLPSEGGDMLHEAGIADVGARWITVSVPYTARVPNADDLAPLLDKLGPVGGTLYVGAADIKDSLHSKRHWAIVAIPRVVALGGVTRRWEPSTKITVAGKFLEIVTEPTLTLARPDGVVSRQSMVVGADGAFTQVIDLPETVGQYVVEIAARWRGAERVLAAAPVGVGMAVANWPIHAADFTVANEKDLETVIVKVVSDVRGRPVVVNPELAAAARACTTALADGKDCAPAAANTRMLAFDVAADSLERMVSEMVAMPSTRSSFKSEAAGVTVSPTKTGQFVVALAFPFEAGAANAEPTPTPAAAPETTPAPTPAAAPAPAATPTPAPAEPPAAK